LNPGEETIEIPIDLEIFGNVITLDVFLGCNRVLFKKFRVIVCIIEKFFWFFIQLYRAHAHKDTMPKNDLTTPVKPLLSLHRSSGLTISGV
jgi:hypothetical protein